MRVRALPAMMLAATAASANIVPTKWLNQSFFFSWDPVGAALPTPVTKQCDTISINWNRGTGTGPDPQAPYTLSLFTSSLQQPTLLTADGTVSQYNFTIPFASGTQYQVCMFDSLGATGGCQAVYTVVDGRPSCGNAPPSLQPLLATANYSQGLLSTYGWPDQCTDITVTPQNGKPPYTFMVLPALHPPVVYTSNSSDPITWKVSLSWGSSFFLSLTDSSDPPLGWTHGPLHSGGNGGTTCLDTDALFSKPGNNNSKGGVSVGVVIGTLFAGLVVGGILGFLVPFFIRRHRERNATHLTGRRSVLGSDGILMRRKSSGRQHMTVTPFNIEPYTPPSAVQPLPVGRTPSTRSTPLESNPHSMSPGSQMYTAHHDLGRTPAVRANMAAEFPGNDLPPNYTASRNGAASQPPPVPREKGRPAHW